MLNCNAYYHVYNHANGFENLFIDAENYPFFIDKMVHYLNPVVEIVAYCLMPNHFHLVVKVKSEEEIQKLFSINMNSEVTDVKKYISKQFANLFSSYTQAFNKYNKRRGSLFMKNFKRKEIEDIFLVKRTIIYLHLNPVKHGFVKDFREWPWISYHSYFTEEELQWLGTARILEIFKDAENFKKLHFLRLEEILNLWP